MTRADRLTLVRQLRDEGLSRRAIALRLKVSKDTVRRDLERLAAEGAPDDAPPAEPGDPAAPQVSEALREESAPDGAPPAEPGESAAPPTERDGAPQGAPVAQLLRRVAHPQLEMDLRQWPAMRRDLAVLRQSGRSVEELVSQAVVVLAFGYRQALDRGEIQPGQPFTVTDMTVRHALRPEAARPRTQDRAVRPESPAGRTAHPQPNV